MWNKEYLGVINVSNSKGLAYFGNITCLISKY